MVDASSHYLNNSKELLEICTIVNVYLDTLHSKQLIFTYIWHTKKT